MKDLIIIGSGGHCRSVISIAKLLASWSTIRIADLDFKNQEEFIMGVKVTSLNECLKRNKDNLEIFTAIGDNQKRKIIYNGLSNEGYKFINLIHPKSFIDQSAHIGNGNYIGQFSNIGAEVKIGNCNIINSYANLEHEVIIGNFNHMAPSTTICGRSRISNNIFMGVNSTIIQNLAISEGVIIGAGSVVFQSIEKDNQKVAGTPARNI